MSRTSQYEKLLAQLKAGELKEIERRILKAFLQKPNGLTRQELVYIVFGARVGRNLNNDTRDRKIRKGIESLRNRGVMIVSTSGGAGYKLDADSETIQSMLRELKSRISRLQERVDMIEYYHPSPKKRK
jgi:predicted DNA-binding transcriptional regulator YafY